MYKPTLLALALLSYGCAHRGDAEDHNFYDYQWSKAGATRETWDRDRHDCNVEHHQRTTYDNIEYQNQQEREWEYNKTLQRMGSPNYYPTSQAWAESMQGRRYWEECMEARQWRISGRKFLASEDNEKDIEEHTNSFKP